MEEQTQTQPAPVQPTPTLPVPTKANIKPLTIIDVLVFLLMAGGLVYLGYQNYQLQQKLNQLSEQKTDQIQPSPPSAIISDDTQKNTFTNQYLTFTYPKLWLIDNSIIYRI